MSVEDTEPPYQPDYADLQPPKKEKSGRGRGSQFTPEEKRKAEVNILDRIIAGYSDVAIAKYLFEEVGITSATAKKWIEKVREEINFIISQRVDDEREYKMWLAERRYEMAIQIAMETKDAKNLIIANQRLTELQGLIPTGSKTGINVQFNNMPGIGQNDLSRLSSRDLLDVVDADYKKIESNNQTGVDTEHVMTEEEAEALLQS